MRYKNIIKPIVFVTGLFLILFVLSFFFIPVNSIDNGPYRKLGGILKEPKNTIDYLAIGDSECTTSIIPMELWKEYGYAGYNSGVPGQRLKDTYYMLEKLLKDQSPRVILMETNAFYRYYQNAQALQNYADETAEEIFPVYKYHNSWKLFHFYMLKDMKKEPKNTRINPMKGYHYNVVVRPYHNGSYIQKTVKIEKIQDQPLFYLNKIIAQCKEKNIQLIFYSAPSPLCWTYAKHNAAATVAHKNGLTYLDLNLKNDVLDINWLKDTRDQGNHVNFRGAKKVTNYIGTYLSEHSNLTDHREDKRYRSWNKALNKYLKLTKQI
jgi:hypothetical protein